MPPKRTAHEALDDGSDTPTKQTRKSYPNEFKRKVAEVYANTSIAAVQEWVRREYPEYGDLNKSQISRWADTSNLLRDDQRRNKSAEWPLLETCLKDWIQRMESTPGASITDTMITHSARSIWDRLQPRMYPDLVPGHKDQPKFSPGWLTAFKKRHATILRQRPGENGPVDYEQVEEELVSVRQKLQEYAPQDIYNCDESGLFWRMAPSRSLGTKNLGAIKLEKARFSITFACNADGSKKLRPWIIGTVALPDAFRDRGLEPKNFELPYRCNRKAWMNSNIFEEYLLWFDAQMSRPTLLLFDNLSAHLVGYESVRRKLKHTNCLCLPTYATSYCQPLEQGIIRAFKIHWRHLWSDYMLEEHELKNNPIRMMNIYYAMRWVVEAWKKTTTTTIASCWLQSTLLGLQGAYQDSLVAEAQLMWEDAESSRSRAAEIETTNEFELLKIIRHVEQQKLMKRTTDISQIVNDPDELVIDNMQLIGEDLICDVTDAYLPIEDEEQEGEKRMYIRPISRSEALDHIERLRIFLDQRQAFKEPQDKAQIHCRALVEIVKAGTKK